MEDRKQVSRARIIESAARLFRRYGYNGVGIDDIMAAANLTRGGFYAHFGSKQDLFAATLMEELELGRRLRDNAETDGQQLAGAARALIEFYLDVGNRKRMPTVCPLISLSSDVSRADAAASAAYTATLRDLVGAIARRVPGSPADANARALAAMALCVGGVVLAQAVDDEELASTLLDACRTRVLAELEAG